MLQTYFFELSKKYVKRILIFQTTLNLLNNSVLQISFQTVSFAYLRIGMSEWHETKKMG